MRPAGTASKWEWTAGGCTTPGFQGVLFEVHWLRTLVIAVLVRLQFDFVGEQLVILAKRRRHWADRTYIRQPCSKERCTAVICSV